MQRRRPIAAQRSGPNPRCRPDRATVKFSDTCGYPGIGAVFKASSRLLATVALLACVAGCYPFASGEAKTLQVGAGYALKVPSAAASAAAAGDTIEIEPGEYLDCAVWGANRLTIVGKGPGVVISDKTCQGKALFVTTGNDITIRNITFTRARVPDQNGAGIRSEGRNLTVEHCRFVNNESGILAGDLAQSAIRISDSEFIGNGKCEGNCAHGVYVGFIALLHIEHSRFSDTKVGHHVKSRALRTELIGNEIADGQKGTASYLVDIPSGGALVMEGNQLEKGPNSENYGTAISVGAEGVTQRTGELLISNNRFTNDNAHETVFVRNLTATEAKLAGNTFKGHVVPLAGDGKVQ